MGGSRLGCNDVDAHASIGYRTRRSLVGWGSGLWAEFSSAKWRVLVNSQAVSNTEVPKTHPVGSSRLLVSTLLCILELSGVGILASSAAAQDPGATSPAQPTGTVRLNFPQEIEIQALVEFVSQRLNINILFDKEIADKRINIKAASEIPVESLLGVLESALKISGLALVDADVPGWKKIVKAEQLPLVAPAGEAAEAMRQYGDATAVTQAFVLKNASTKEVEELIKPFLTQPGSNVVSVPRSNTLIVTDYAANLVRIAKWMESIDQPKARWPSNSCGGTPAVPT